MYLIGQKKYFTTYTEAKFTLLSQLHASLSDLKLEETTYLKIKSWCALLQCKIEEHCQDVSQIVNPYELLSSSEKCLLKEYVNLDLIERINQSPYGFVPIKLKGEDILFRAYESALPTLLLLQPTENMKAIQKKLSDAICEQVKVYREHNYEYLAICDFYKHKTDEANSNYYPHFKRFAYSLLHPVPDRVHLGGYTIEEVNASFIKQHIPVLDTNFNKSSPLSNVQVEGLLSMAMNDLAKNKDIERVLYIQFMFAWSIMRTIPLFNTNPEPIGIFKNIIEKDYQTFNVFKDSLASASAEGLNARTRLFKHIFFSDYYKTDKKFGRDGPIDNNESTYYYGVFSQKNIELLSQNFPQALTKNITNVFWTPDTVAQAIDYDSVIVEECLKNEAVFISGPSGTYSLLISAFEMLVHYSTLIEKQIYLQNMLAYIVGTGLHSIDEVLGPAQMTMGLIPNYRVEIPKAEGGTVAPNFNAFYDLACENDPSFINIRSQSWSLLMEFCLKGLEQTPLISSEMLFKWVLDASLQTNLAHDTKEGQAIKLLLDNQETTLPNGINPLAWGIMEDNLSLINFLKEQSALKTEENNEMLMVYDKLKRLKNYSPFFELTFDPIDKSFSLISKTYINDEFDEPYDLNEYKDEIQDFFDNLGLEQHVSENVQKHTYSINFGVGKYSQIVCELRHLALSDLSSSHKKAAKHRL
tara:strand:- start:13939 stop:16026 length:2088 start_codon:yes stop_codon:yes gene_type:complete